MNSVWPASASVNRLQKEPAKGLMRGLCDSDCSYAGVEMRQMERNSSTRRPHWGNASTLAVGGTQGREREAPETKTLGAEIPLDFL